MQEEQRELRDCEKLEARRRTLEYVGSHKKAPKHGKWQEIADSFPSLGAQKKIGKRTWQSKTHTFPVWNASCLAQIAVLTVCQGTDGQFVSFWRW